MTQIIHGLWIGRQLGLLEELTLRSFTHYGHEFHLWHYEPLSGIAMPTGVVLRNANEILTKDKIFRYPEKTLLGFGGGSLAGFSDVFRYKVLYEHGGWWSDLDVTCLRPLDEVTDDYWFREHGVLLLVGNIMKTPAKSELMKRVFERAVKEVNGQQADWHHGIRILCYNVEYLGLDKYVHHNECNLDSYDHIWKLVHHSLDLSELPPWRFIHWTHSVMNMDYASGSIYEQLCRRFDCRNMKERLRLI